MATQRRHRTSLIPRELGAGSARDDLTAATPRQLPLRSDLARFEGGHRFDLFATLQRLDQLPWIIPTTISTAVPDSLAEQLALQDRRIEIRADRPERSITRRALAFPAVTKKSAVRLVLLSPTSPASSAAQQTRNGRPRIASPTSRSSDVLTV